MTSPLRARATAACVALVAAFLWATYYLFVLKVTPGTRPSAVLFYPFAAGGLTYAAWTFVRGQGRDLLRTFAEPAAYGRVGLMLACQFSVLAATYLTGPVDASLLSLLGDVVATPVLAAAILAIRRAELTSPGVVAGMLLSLAGGTLAIVGGTGLHAVHGPGWLIVVALPLAVAFYFVVSARAGASTPIAVVVAQSMLGAALVTALIAPLLPGGWVGILHVAAGPLVLLLVNGVLSFFLAPLLYFAAIGRGGFVLPPMMMTGIPVFTLLLTASVLGIAPAALALLGVPIAAVGGILALALGSGPSGAPGGADELTANR